MLDLNSRSLNIENSLLDIGYSFKLNKQVIPMGLILLWFTQSTRHFRGCVKTPTQPNIFG